MKMRQLGYTAAWAAGALVMAGEAMAVSVAVPNSQFEAPGLVATAAPTESRGSWGLAAWAGGSISAYSPATAYPSQDGGNVGSLSIGGAQSGGSAFYQDAVLIKEGTYELTVGVAQEPGAEPTTEPFRINFESTGFGPPTALLGENDFALGSFSNTDLTDVTATISIPSGSPEIGRYLRPVLLLTGQDAGANPSDPRASYDLDNVQLQYTAPGGAPESLAVGQHSFDPLVWQRPAGSGGNAGEYRPLAPVFANQVGDQLGFISLRDHAGSWGALYQDVTTIGEGTYTMTIGVAHEPGYEPLAAPLSLNFEAVGGGLPTTLIGANTIPLGAISNNEFTEITVSVNVPVGAAQIGQDLRLVMVAAGQEAGSNPQDPRATYLLDNVRLDFVATPEPTSAALACLVITAGACRRGSRRRS
ncbi:hypothetical protein Mal64_07830 [Pseudobythopirellula maris]|uniref:Di-glucose binding within endoplasmic reticulum n=1 Tax=Pseudobythopirellula maris TaxID=2527991 RepID=A0A5C5ZS82_9BACT|nr:hypothetical protein [Pseudobythopirellula maris]TWT90394.1 hypothetical protein Mal64_07830 [Pseudobythopirellula maris]